MLSLARSRELVGLSAASLPRAGAVPIDPDLDML